MAEARAKIYAMLANAWHYPDETLVAFLWESDEADCWPEAVEAFSSKVNAQIQNLHEACVQYRGRPAADVLDELRLTHGRLFGHSVRGTCPPYELEYGRSEIIQQTAELADLSGFYNAFGMNVKESAFERPDHMSVECEFLGVLCAKEAWGRQQGHSEMAETCSDAQRLFLRDHLGKWMPAFAHRIMKEDPEGLFGCVAALAAAFVTDECRRFDIEAGPQWIELRPIDPASDASIDCDTSGCGSAAANALVQIGIEGSAGAGDAE